VAANHAGKFSFYTPVFVLSWKEAVLEHPVELHDGREVSESVGGHGTKKKPYLPSAFKSVTSECFLSTYRFIVVRNTA
jgi:hypothetical protein